MRGKTNLTTCMVVTILLLVMAWPALGKIIFVDRDSPTESFDGSSWSKAFKYMQDGLEAALSGDEICVAQGIYKPDDTGKVDLDAFVANIGGSEVWFNNGQGTFTDSGQDLANPGSYGVELGDLDSDGDLDAFVANHSYPNKVWFNDGQGVFSDSGQSLGNSESMDVVLGDVDGDGDLDAFVANSELNPNKVWLNDGLGTFTDSGQGLGNSSSYAVALGDLDSDGDLDAFVANYNQHNKVWFNDGQGVFSNSGQDLGYFSSTDVALGDLDGDGDLDAFVANYNQHNKVWLNDGQGVFTDSGQGLGSSYSWGVALGDVDGDGDFDAFVANKNVNHVWINTGSGLFDDSPRSVGVSDSRDVALGDVDSDGNLDVFVANHLINKVWLNDGQGFFTDSGQILSGDYSEDVALGDLDRDAVSLGDRAATFRLKNGVTIKGGYAGFGEPDPNARDIKMYKTILSGDLNGDDGPDFANNGENSYHVITCSGVDETAVLDGFTITAGNANGPTLLDGRGGGILCYANGSPTIKRCRFTNNSSAVFGGAIYCQYDSQSNPTITDCIFTANTANSGGGAMYNHRTCDPTLTNCLFNGNFTPGHGGGIFSYSDSSPILTNCTLTGNSAGSNGGGLYNFSGSNPTLTNCILWGNSDSGGYVEYSQITDSNNNTTINYSCMQGWTGFFGGTGNMGDDPMFKDADGPDGILGTEDDDLRLSVGSPCIDAGDNTMVTPEITTDLGGAPRIAGWIVDMGTFEWDSPVAYWRLDEVAGNIAHDSSGNGHNGTAQSTPTRVDGPPGYGKAMYFDGSNPTPAWVDCGTWNPSANTGQLTVALWIRWDGPVPGVWQGVIGKRDTYDEQATQMMWIIEISEQNQTIYFNRAGCYPYCGDVVLPEGEWSHVAVTFDGSTMIFYIDGRETGRGNFSFGAKTDSTLRFGSHELGYGGFHGALDDIRLYNYALSSDGIRRLLCKKPPRGDVNGDCRFDFVDLAILLSEWLDCGMMIPELCAQ